MADRIRVEIEGDAGDLRAALRQSSAEIKAWSATTERENKRVSRSNADTDRSFNNLTGSVGRTNASFSLLRNSMQLLKWPALIAGAGGAAQGLSALAAGAVGLTSALSPLAGALAAYPALLGLMGQAAGVTALAGVDDLTGAVGGLNEKLDESSDAFKKLSPEAQAFARELQAAKEPFRELQQLAQGQLFAGADEALSDAMGNLDNLRGVVDATAASMSELVRHAGRFVGREGFGRDFEAVGRSNAKVMLDLGDAGFNFADALRHVMVEARPLIRWMAEGIESFSGFIEAEAKAGRESGALADYFGETRDVIERLVSIGGSLADVFGEIMVAAKPLGDDILKSFDEGADSLERWAESTQGQSDLAKFFEDAHDPLYEAGRLISDMVEEFFKLAQTPGLTQLIHKLRVDLLPVLVDATAETTAAFGPHLVDLLVQLGQTFATFAGSSGPLVHFVDMLTEALKVLNDLLDSNDALKTLAVSFVGLAGIVKAIKFGAAISGVTTLIGLFGKLEGAAAGAAAAEGAAGGGAGGASLLARFFGGPAALAALPAAMTALVMGLDEMQTTRLESLGNDLDGIVEGLDTIGEQSGAVKERISGLDDELKSAAENMRNLDLTDKTPAALGGPRGSTIVPVPDKTAVDKVKTVIDQLKDKFGSLQIAARNMTGKSRQAFREFAMAARQSGAITYSEWAKLDSAFSNVTAKIERNAKQAAQVTGENWKDIARATKGMRVSVSKDYDGMVNAVGGGLQILTQNTQKALAAVGLKQELKWQVTRSDGAGGIQGHPQARGGLLGLAGGGMVRVPGSGLEDNTPLIANGTMNVVAPGEDVAVFNRHQRPMIDAAVSAAYGVGGLKGFFGRFNKPHYMAQGGTIPGATSGLHTGIMDLLNSLYSRFGGTVSSGLRAGTLHGTGQAADYVPSDWAGAARAANSAGPSLLEGIYNGAMGGPPVSWDTGQHVDPGFWGSSTWADHGDHLHLAVADGVKAALGKGFAGATVEKIKRVILTPKTIGALSDGGQSALDKVWNQANKLIEEKAGQAGGSGYVTGGGGAVAAQMGRILLKTGWNRTGAAGVIGNAYRESLWNPASVGTGGGGLFGFTTPPISLADLQSFAKQNGKPWTDVALQMQFMQNHLSGSVKQATMGAGSPEAAAERFMTLWERPGIPALSERQAAARQAYEMKTWERGGMLSKGGFGTRLPNMDVKGLIRRIGKVDGKKQSKLLRAFGNKIDDFRLDKDLKRKIKRTTADFDDYYEAAGFAGQIDEGMGKYRGHTEAEWLKKALPKLAKLRNLLITADNHLDRMRKALEAQQKAAREELQRIAKKLKAIEREKKGLDSKKDKQRIDSLDDEAKKLGARQKVLKSRLIPTISDQVRALTSDDRGIMSSLVDVQGRSGPMRKMRHLPDPPPWKFGGSIFDVQSRLKELGSAAGADDSELASLLREELDQSNLSRSLSESQYGVFQGFFDEFRSQLPFVGTYDHGTYPKTVGRTGFARIHKDEAIVKDPEGPFVNMAAQSAAGPTEIKVYIEGDAAPLMKRVRAEIDGRAVNVVDRQIGRRSRQLAVAPGG